MANVVESVSRAVRGSLRNKILIGAGMVTVVASLALTWQSNLRITELAMAQVLDRGRGQTDELAKKLEQAMLLANFAAVQQMLDEAKKGDAFSYLVVTNEKGNPVANTFAGGNLPPEVTATLATTTDKGTVSNLLQVGGHSVILLDEDLMQGSLGRLHVGLDTRSADELVSREFRKAFLTVVVILAISFAILWFAFERLVSPITQLTLVVKRIVEEGDLTQRISVASEDEVGRLAAYFAEMVERLRKVPLELGKSAETLSQAVAALEAATAQQNSTITRQATALQETQVTAEEIKQTSQTAARSAQGILEATQRADEIGRKGEESVEQSLEALSDMRAQVGEIAKRINELGDRTRQIGDITNTVKELADQSNMLALNAAIEAVRAGEHGKGFSLVAREIRRLADQSIQATNRVREILESVSSAAAAAVKNTESGASRIEVGLSQAKASGDNLKALAGMVRDNNAAVRQIASAVNQQNTGVGQVFTAVMDQSRMMDDTVKQLENALKNVDTLKQVSRDVLEVVRSYKV